MPGNRASTVLRGPGRGNALRLPDNTVINHISVLHDALAQIPARFRRRLIVRCDGAGAARDLLTHIRALNTARRTVHFVVGWKVTDLDEHAIAALPAAVWSPAVGQDGEVQAECQVAELTGLDERLGTWPAGTRLIVRRSRPSRRHERKLTDFEKRTGWRYQITATSIPSLAGVPGSHHPFFLDALYRDRGSVRTR